MSQSAAVAAAIASADPVRVAEDMPPHAARAQTPSPDRLDVELWARPLVISASWWLLIAVAVVEGLAK